MCPGFMAERFLGLQAATRCEASSNVRAPSCFFTQCTVPSNSMPNGDSNFLMSDATRRERASVSVRHASKTATGVPDYRAGTVIAIAA